MNLPKYFNSLQKKGILYFSSEDLVHEFKEKKENLIANLQYFKNKGRIISPLKGFYIILPLEDQDRGCLDPQEMVIICMEYLKIPYYAGLLTAASYHGASHQPPQVFQVVTSKRMSKPWVFGNVYIDFTYKKDVTSTEIEKRTGKSGYLNISTPEETAKDILTYHNKSGGLNHQATILSELIEAIDEVKLIELARKYRSTFWIQRMGYILEHIEPFDDKKRDIIVQALKSYLKKVKHKYVLLEPGLPIKDMPRDMIWKIIENTDVESDI